MTKVSRAAVSTCAILCRFWFCHGSRIIYYGHCLIKRIDINAIVAVAYGVDFSPLLNNASTSLWRYKKNKAAAPTTHIAINCAWVIPKISLGFRLMNSTRYRNKLCSIKNILNLKPLGHSFSRIFQKKANIKKEKADS